jgi:DNA-binding SARP family transcriptional activator
VPADLAHRRRSPAWYGRLAARIGEIETRATKEPEPVVLSVLSALRRLCIACGDCSAEAERHDRARAAALSCERDLQRDIAVLVESLQDTVPAANIRDIDALAQAVEERSRPAKVGVAARTPERSHPVLAIHCLGAFQAFVADRLVEDWPGHKATSLFKYLVLHRRRRVPKDVLYELFWPDKDQEACRRNLHQAIYSLRHTIRRRRPDIRPVVYEDDCYFLNPVMEIWVDAEEFEEHAAAGRRLDEQERRSEAMAEYDRAEALYRGPLLEECLYEDWAAPERERLRAMYTHVARRLAVGYMERQEYSAAIVLCQKELALDRCDEDVHRRLMRCYYAQGQRHLALRQFRVCAEALRAEFNLVPSPETVALNDVQSRRP